MMTEIEPKNSANTENASINIPKKALDKKQTGLDKNTFLSKIIKTCVFALIAAFAITGTFYFETTQVQNNLLQETGTTVSIDYNKENIIPNNGIIRVDSESSPSIDVISGADSISNSDQTQAATILSINYANIWGNFQISDAKINILADRVVFIPDHATFDLQATDKRINLQVYDGDVYMGFLEEGTTLTQYADKYSPLFINRLLVPRDSQVDIPFSKVDERIKKLLYSKLIKEFKFGAIPEDDENSEWVKENRNLDNVYIESVKKDFESDVLQRGAKNSDNAFKEAIFWAEENLTFVPEKKRDMVFEHLFAYINDAIFYSVSGDAKAATSSLDDFTSYLSIILPDPALSEEFYQKYDDQIAKLSIFGPGEDPYNLLKELLDKKFTQNRDTYEIVDAFWQNVYRGMDGSKVLAEEALNDYFEYLDVTLSQDADPFLFEIYLTYQNQLFDNLFLRYPLFYKDGYFAIKNALEQKLLDQYENGQLKEELAQDFISRKIDFLKRLRSFFFDGEVTVAEAKEILSRLVAEVDDLMPANTGDLAVIELFETQLKDIGDFWGYLNSPQYHTSATYGSTQKERYESYLVEKDKIWSFIDVHKEVLGEDLAIETTVEDVEKSIKSVFDKVEEISDLKIGEIKDVNQRYVEVSGVIGGYPFTAEYDRDHEKLQSVMVYGELISDKPLKLKSLLEVLQDKYAQLADEYDLEEEEYTLETDAQRTARLAIAQQISEAGFEVSMENIAVLDEIGAEYRVTEIYMQGYEDTVLTFDFSLQGYLIKNLYVEFDGEPLVMDGEYTLEQLKDIVYAENDFDNEKLAR